MGWDYLVQRPPERRPGVLLDHRPLGLSCHVQVKTVWVSRTPRAVLSLAAAERLAKHEGPAFILLITAKPDALGRPVLDQIWLIHLVGAAMRRVLHRLRQVEVGAKPKSLPQQTIRFGPSDGVRLATGGADLDRRLADDCGEDARTYADTKAQARERLGYEAGGVRVTASFRAPSEAHLVDMMLGLEPAIMSNVRVFDTRFGLDVRVQHPGDAEWSFETLPSRTCTIRVFGSALLPPVVLSADIFVPPISDLPSELRKVRFRTELFDLTWDIRGNIHFTADYPLKPGLRSLSHWKRDLRFAELMADPTITIEVETDASPTPLRLPAMSLNHEGLGAAGVLRRTVQALTGLCELAGLGDASVELDDVYRQRAQIETAKGLLLAEEAAVWDPFVTPLPVAENQAVTAMIGIETTLLYVDRLRFGELVIAVSGRLTVQPDRREDQLVWQVRRTEPGAVRIIAPTDEAISAFAESEQDKAQARGRLVSSGAEPARLEPMPCEGASGSRGDARPS